MKTLRPLLILVALALAVLAACAPAATLPTSSPPTAAPAAAATTAPAATTAAAAATSAPAATTAPAAATSAPAATTAGGSSSTGPVELTMWWLTTSKAVQAVAQKALDNYTAAHPNVTIKPTFYSYQDYSQAMPAALAAGNPPDLSFGDPTAPNLPNYVAAGQMTPLDDVIAQRGWADKLQPGVTTFYNPLTQGKTYGIPLYEAHRGIFYNKKIMDEIGGKPPTTLDELDALLAKAKAAGYTPLGLGNSDKYGVDLYWLNLLLDYMPTADVQNFVKGAMTHDPSLKWNTDAVKQAMQKVLDWEQKGYFNSDYASISSGDVHTQFAQGKMFAYAGDSNANDQLIADKPGFDIGWFNFPKADASKPSFTISDPGQVLMLPKDSKHPQQAEDLMDYLLSPEVGKLLADSGLLALHKTDLSAAQVPPFVKDEIASVPGVTPVGWLNYDAPGDFADKQGSELQKLLAGQTTLDAYLTAIQGFYDTAIKQQ